MVVSPRKGIESRVVVISPRRELDNGLYRAVGDWNIVFARVMNDRGIEIAVPETYVLGTDSMGPLEGDIGVLWKEDNLYAIFPEASLGGRKPDRERYLDAKVDILKRYYAEKNIPVIGIGAHAEREIESWRNSRTPFAIYEEELRGIEREIPENNLLYEKLNCSVKESLKDLAAFLILRLKKYKSAADFVS